MHGLHFVQQSVCRSSQISKLAPAKIGRKIPHLPSEEEIRRFYVAIDRAEDLQHAIMLRLLLLTGVRVSELCSIRIEDVDLEAHKIFVNQGKGAKDRYVLFPEAFRLLLRAHMAAHSDFAYLFETERKTKFSPRRIQEIVKDYARDAGITARIHPHLLRHFLISLLTREGVPDAQIQLISGHSSRKSLQIYQHVALGDVQPRYEEALKKLGVL